MSGNGEFAISARGLTRHFGDLVAVEDLDVDLPMGSVIGLVGPNGSGKSTTIRMLLGLLNPTRGTATVLGRSIETPDAYCDMVGALIENPAFIPNISGRSNLESMALLRGVPSARVAGVLSTVGLSEHADRKASEYSLGMKQRLGIAIALLPDPQLLIFDEPTNGLDPAGIVEIRALLRQFANEGRTVVVSSHLLSEIQAAADYLVMIREGKHLFSGPLEGLLARERRFVDVEPTNPSDLTDLSGCLTRAGFEVESQGGGLRVLADPKLSGQINATAAGAGIMLAKLVPHSESLEDVFLRMTGDPGGAA